jgi:hypothetical protein
MHVTDFLQLCRIVMSSRSRDKTDMRPSSQQAHRWGESGGGKRMVTRLLRSTSQSMHMTLLLLPPPPPPPPPLLRQLRTRFAPVYKTSPEKQQHATPDLWALNCEGGNGNAAAGGRGRGGCGSCMQNTEPCRVPTHAIAPPSPQAHVTPPEAFGPRLIRETKAPVSQVITTTSPAAQAIITKGAEVRGASKATEVTGRDGSERGWLHGSDCQLRHSSVSASSALLPELLRRMSTWVQHRREGRRREGAGAREGCIKAKKKAGCQEFPYMN